MTAELTPFLRESGNNLHRFFCRTFYHPPAPPPPSVSLSPSPGSREQNKPGLNGNYQLSILISLS